MDQHQIAALARSLRRTPSCRDVLRGCIGPGLGAVHRSAVVEASKKAAPNTFGCLSVGMSCAHDGSCCSAICAGKAGKTPCQMHSAGMCDQEPERVLAPLHLLGAVGDGLVRDSPP